jgi:hypothetical protein
MDLAKFEFDHDVTAERHYVNCSEIFESAKNIHDLVHAALELRICIERLCFEYLVLLTHKSRELSKKETKAYKPKAILKNVVKEEPHFNKMANFANAVLMQRRAPIRVVAPDSDWLVELHGKLNDYLHLQTEPLKNEEIGRLLSAIKDSLPRLRTYLTSRGKIYNLAEHSRSILDKYVNDEITEEQMKKMIQLADIPDHLFNPDKT